MAHVLPCKLTLRDVTLSFIYNIDFDVGGPQRQGSRADILLVQSLFNARFSALQNVPSVQNGQILRGLNVDGICGTRTADAIWSYQRFIAKHDRTKDHHNMYVDGLVSSANATGYSTKSHTIYTIVLLNFHLASLFDGALPDPDFFQKEPLVSQLKASLQGQSQGKAA